MSDSPQTQILATSEQVGEAVSRLAAAIRAKIADPGKAAFIGIHTHGVPLARRLKKLFDEQYGTDAPFGTVDITLYRDDYDLRGVKPRIQSSEIRFSIDGRELVLVDDVLFTGRTIRAAIESLGDYGRPNAIRLAALVDRGHRELPIQPDVSGLIFATEKEDRIRVRMQELDGVDEVLLVRG
jgi:pyrimidine operon attenuation protein/uracil phosphoribosyltransferase